MFEWLSIGLLSFAIAKKSTKWRFRVPLALLAGFVSAGIGAFSMLGDDPVKKIDKVLIGGVINWIVCILVLSFLAWILRPTEKGDATPLPNETLKTPTIITATVSNIMPPESQNMSPLQTIVDEERVYAEIAKELETGVTDKGLWTRLFAECGGDEKQIKVRYIKKRADQLISVERLRLEQVASERAVEAERVEKLRPPPTDAQQMEGYGITFDGERYNYGEYKYDRLSDAISYAKLQKGRSA